MSGVIPTKSPPSKNKKNRDKEKEKKERTLSQAVPTERLKTVVRRLPPNLPEEIFWQSVQTWVTDETVIWKTYFPGKFRKRCALLLAAYKQFLTLNSLNKENIPSRAYIAFKTEDQVAEFGQGFDGHVFKDKAGWCRLLGPLEVDYMRPQGLSLKLWWNLRHTKRYLQRRRNRMQGLVPLRKVRRPRKSLPALALNATAQ